MRPRDKHNPDRVGYRHGAEAGSVTLGGRRVPVERPRVRAVDGSGELPVPAYELVSCTEVLGELAMARMLAGLSARHYRAGLEPVGAAVEAAASATSTSAVSRRFVTATETALAELLAAPLDRPDLVASMVDDHCWVVALGIDLTDSKHPLAVVEGSTENATLVADLIVGLRNRGLDVTKPILAVLDGSTALRRAVRDVFDARSCSQRSTQRRSPTRRRPRAAARLLRLPAEHWVHLKTSNPIESTFATVRLRTKVTKGPGSRAAGLAMVFKLLEAAQERWRYVNGAHLVALVRAGAKFEKGALLERPE